MSTRGAQWGYTYVVDGNSGHVHIWIASQSELRCPFCSILSIHVFFSFPPPLQLINEFIVHWATTEPPPDSPFDWLQSLCKPGHGNTRRRGQQKVTLQGKMEREGGGEGSPNIIPPRQSKGLHCIPFRIHFVWDPHFYLPSTWPGLAWLDVPWTTEWLAEAELIRPIGISSSSECGAGGYILIPEEVQDYYYYPRL